MIERRNFTLLEVVLAMSIFAVLTMLTGAVVYALPRSYAMQREQARRMEGLGRLERVLDGTLRNAVPFSWKDANGVSKQVFLGEPAWMIFAFRCRIEEGGAGLRFAALGLAGDRVKIQYREAPILCFRKETMPETLNEETLLEEVKSLEILYADNRNGELTWLEDWPENEKNEIPQAVGLIVTFTDDTQAKFLRRTAGNSFYTSYGRRP